MTDQTLLGSYAYGPIVLSVLIAILASYTSLDLAGRVTASRGRARLVWLVAGSTSMGIGIWSMHFVGMLAFSLPVSIQYDWRTVLLSLLAGVFASVVSLFVVSRPRMGPIACPFGQRLYGWGDRGSALHCHGCDAPRGDVPLFSGAGGCFGSVGDRGFVDWLSGLRSSSGTKHQAEWKRKISSALLMGAAIVSMHYTAMAAASFTPSAMPRDLSHAVSVSTLAIAGIGGVPAMVLVITLLTTMVDRLQEQKTLLDELFEQAPTAIALVNGRSGSSA